LKSKSAKSEPELQVPIDLSARLLERLGKIFLKRDVREREFNQIRVALDSVRFLAWRSKAGLIRPPIRLLFSLRRPDSAAAFITASTRVACIVFATFSVRAVERLEAGLDMINLVCAGIISPRPIVEPRQIEHLDILQQLDEGSRPVIGGGFALLGRRRAGIAGRA
jgi:hypothetical protein